MNDKVFSAGFNPEMLESFKKPSSFKLADYSSFLNTGYNIDSINRALRDSVQQLETSVPRGVPEGYFEKTQEYQQKSLEMLQAINENTANLYTLVELINQNNEKQDELIALMTEILSMAKAKSKEEADSLFKKIMEGISNTTDNVESMIKIMGWATTVYNMVLPLLSQ